MVVPPEEDGRMVEVDLAVVEVVGQVPVPVVGFHRSVANGHVPSNRFLKSGRVYMSRNMRKRLW